QAGQTPLALPSPMGRTRMYRPTDRDFLWPEIGDLEPRSISAIRKVAGSVAGTKDTNLLRSTLATTVRYRMNSSTEFCSRTSQRRDCKHATSGQMENGLRLGGPSLRSWHCNIGAGCARRFGRVTRGRSCHVAAFVTGDLSEQPAADHGAGLVC